MAIRSVYKGEHIRMGLLIQLIGLVCVLISLVWNIYNIAQGTPASVALAFFVVGMILIQLGRKLRRK